ncbi:MAG: 50S ribosomal protein L36 [Rickettsiales bacterium]|jgi:large subunit ribosomal protein L36|nr:50S ribosomal protein L36 [Rickettsiales bacterium]
MKVVGSIKNLKNRDKNCKVVRRGKSLVILNDKKPRCKAKQGKN